MLNVAKYLKLILTNKCYSQAYLKTFRFFMVLT